jgi:hypothetical protein
MYLDRWQQPVYDICSPSRAGGTRHILAGPFQMSARDQENGRDWKLRNPKVVAAPHRHYPLFGQPLPCRLPQNALYLHRAACLGLGSSLSYIRRVGHRQTAARQGGPHIFTQGGVCEGSMWPKSRGKRVARTCNSRHTDLQPDTRH